MVKELPEGRGRWFFPAECWLAAGRRDSRVERELTCLRGGLGFQKVPSRPQVAPGQGGHRGEVERAGRSPVRPAVLGGPG